MTTPTASMDASTPTRRPVRDAILPLLAFLLLPSMILGRGLLRERTFGAADIVVSLSPFAGEVVPVGTTPSNGLLSDQCFQFYPWAHYARARIADGEWPLWNPHTRCGRPFLANPQTTLFSPAAIVGLLFPLPYAPLATAWFTLFIAGLGVFVLLRRLRAGLVGSYLGGIGFMFASANVVWLGYPMAQVTAWTGWMMWGFLRVIDRPNAMRTSMLAGILAAQFFGGHPESSFHLAAFALPIIGVALVRGRDRGLGAGLVRPGAAMLGASVIALLVVSIQLLPFAEYLGASDALAKRAGHTEPGSVPFTLAATAFMPDFFGNPARDGFWLKLGNYNENTFYPGIVIVFLALLGCALPHATRGLSIGFAGMAAVALGVAYHAPLLFPAVTALPGFDVAANGRLFFVASFALAVAAGLGATAVLAHLADAAARRRLFAWSFVAAALLLVAAGAAGYRALDAHASVTTASLPPAITKAVAWSAGRFLVLLGIVLAVTLLAAGPGLRRGTVAVLVVVAALADSYTFASGYNAVTRLRRWYPADPLLTGMAATPGRMVGMGVTLPPETAAHYGLADIRGYDAIEPSWMKRFQRETGLFHPADFALLERPTTALNLLGVTSVLTPPVDIAPLWIRRVDAGTTHAVEGQAGRTIDRVALYAAVVEADTLGEGAVAGTLTVTGTGGERHAFPLRIGHEIDALKDGNERDAGATPHAVLPIEGFGDARIFRAAFALPAPVAVRAIDITAAPGAHAIVFARVETTPSRWNDANPGYARVAGHRGGRVYRNPWALPRVFLAQRRTTMDEADIYRAIRDERIEPRAVVLVPEASAPTPRSFPSPTPPPVRRGRSSGQATIVEDRVERIVIDAVSDAASVLVLGDTWFPGWHATVDGRETAIHRAFGALRAVDVPAGEHRIEFVYRPRPFVIGRALSAAGLAVIALLLVLGVVGMVRGRGQH